ncbi:hypothetical protein IU433_13675 [Nocardia puris]|uniref:Uncharacterized protein n=1 Tax=Nocardia puris TaxID=208602 RepID=A0A366DMU6_9NOCA|nr:hypothetical protein [Nocardia puris]MBF6213449.1 hypothetical protein [Nocardia puris]MBF6365621.1 hypothetical protein [Nocardia puris]MBF6460087.1 hypothetical protein [Nocardia puris]RBO91427.1 hypothetical protein DFR74_104129 [Nocardia puris]
MSDGGGVRERVVAAVYSAALALLVVGPLLGPGYLLLRDAVSTPRSYPTDSALGLGDAAPRAVPQDGLLAAVSTVVDGGIVVKAILVAALWAAGYGAAVLTRELLGARLAAQLVAVTVAVWNPYVAERLLQGHWSLLTGYAALPWIVLAAYRIRTGGQSGNPDRDRSPFQASNPTHTRSGENADSAPNIADQSREQGDRSRARGSESKGPLAVGEHTWRAWAMLAGALAAAGLTPTGALLAGVTAAVTVGWRRLPVLVALVVAASAPWLVATALSGGGAEPSDPAGIAAFAARAEPWLGTLGSLAGLGGIWNGDAVPDSRTTPIAFLATLLLLAVVAAGVRTVLTDGARGRDSLAVRRALVALAGAAVVLPALAATGWGMAAMEWLVVNVPGAGLLRDTQKYVALAVPAYALCAAAACGALARVLSSADDVAPQQDRPSRGSLALIAAALIAAVILPLLDLAWSVGGSLRPVRYPAGWELVAQRVDAPGDVAVLPAGMFRKFPYTGPAPVLDPAPRMLPNDVLQTGELPVRGRTVAGEGTRAREVEDLLLRGGDATDLAALGVGWVLVERTTPGPLGDSEATLAQLNPAYTDDHLALYRVPGVVTDDHVTPVRRWTAIAAHLIWAALLLGAPVAALVLRRRPR